jgi:hypothetical protein
MIFDPLQHINQIFIRVNIVQPASGEQALHNTYGDPPLGW